MIDDSPCRSPATPGQQQRWSPALWGLLLVLSGNMLLDALEVSVAMVALPAIGAELRLSLAGLQWVVSGFALGFGGLLLFAGRVVELLGRRRVYLVALLVFAAASILGGLADTGALLIATRFVKGLCAAATAPTGLAIIASTFPEGRQRNRAVSIYALLGATGFSAGLLLSGALTAVSWRWTFISPAPVAAVLFLCGLRLIPRDTPGTDPVRKFDLAGAVTFVAAATALVYVIVNAPEIGWTRPRTLGGFAVVALLLAAFAFIERSSARSLVRLSLLANRQLISSALGAAILNGCYWGFLFIATFHLQLVLGWTPMQTGLALLPASVPLAVSALFSTRVVGRYGAARLITLGAAAPPVGYALYFGLGRSSTYLAGILPTVALIGTGFVFAFAALHIQAIAGIPRPGQLPASGFYQTAVQLGGCVLLALVVGLLGDDRHRSPADTVLAAHRPALALITAVGAAGFLLALTSVATTRDHTRPRPPARGTVPTP